jgi:hypothetical protein
MEYFRQEIEIAICYDEGESHRFKGRMCDQTIYRAAFRYHHVYHDGLQIGKGH